ncbi:MAG: sulfatase [Balneolaceae bacterium]|nr:sulfatase [Balneolaceae bacterium]
MFISVDDLNDWVGVMEGAHSQVHTPNIDRLAEQGVLFNNAHTQAPICKPSRESLMSGKLPSTTGMYLLGDYHFRDSPALKDHVVLPEHYRNQGYRVLGTGKLYHGSAERERQEFHEYGPVARAGPYPDEKINYPLPPKLWDWGAFPNSDEQLQDDRITTWAIGQLEKSHDQPFFLGVGYFRPHVPLYVPEYWFKQVPAEDKIMVPEIDADISEYVRRLTYSGLAPRHDWVVENRQWRKAIRAYLASIRFVDHQIGRLMGALEQSMYADNTIIVLFSDHGFALGERRRWAKRALWEPETRVPLIFSGPGIPEGLTTQQPAGLIDIYPTLIALCGLDQVSGLEGQSLVPQLHDPNADRAPVITTFWYNNHAVRSRNFRYIRYHNGEEELYDHRTDPDEIQNLADNPDYRSVKQSLHSYLPDNNAKPIEGNRYRSLGVQEEHARQFRYESLK